MFKSSVKEILSAPITLARRSTDEEKEVFADKKNSHLFLVGSPSGYFYTIGLASGQKFVAHMGFENRQINSYTLRPLDNLLPNLKEIQWKTCNLFPEHGGTTTYCRLWNLSQEKREMYQKELSPKERWVQLSGPHKYNPQRVLDPHPMLDKLEQILSTIEKCEKSKRELFEAQNKLKSLEVLEEKGSSVNTKQIIQKVRKENTNG